MLLSGYLPAVWPGPLLALLLLQFIAAQTHDQAGPELDDASTSPGDDPSTPSDVVDNPDLRYEYPSVGADGRFASPFPHPEGCRDGEHLYGGFCRGGFRWARRPYHIVCGPPASEPGRRDYPPGKGYRRIEGLCPIGFSCFALGPVPEDPPPRGHARIRQGERPEGVAKFDCVSLEEWRRRRGRPIGGKVGRPRGSKTRGAKRKGESSHTSLPAAEVDRSDREPDLTPWTAVQPSTVATPPEPTPLFDAWPWDEYLASSWADDLSFLNSP